MVWEEMVDAHNVTLQNDTLVIVCKSKLGISVLELNYGVLFRDFIGSCSRRRREGLQYNTCKLLKIARGVIAKLFCV